MRANGGHTGSRLIAGFALVVALLCITAGSAVAAPLLGVELERDEPVVSHSDERVDYTVVVKNASPSNAPVGVGDVLFCAGAEPLKEWISAEEEPDVFEFEWMRNGTVIAGAEAETYTVTAGDEGKALQCQVKGTNSFASSKYASLPPVVVEPSPVPRPPEPAEATAEAARPTIEPETGVEERTCTPPTNWVEDHDGNPSTAPVPFAGSWAFQWLRNGEVIPGATAATYTPEVPGDDDEINLQCQVTASNAGGSVVGVSQRTAVNMFQGAIPRLEPSDTPEAFTEAIVSPVTLEVELFGGLETFVRETEGSSWSCATHPATPADSAKAVCTISEVVGPGGSFEPLGLVVRIGADAPDHAVVTATASGGAAAPAVAVDEFDFSPFKPFGIEAFETEVLDALGGDYTQAGGHPFSAAASFSFRTKRRLSPLNESELLVPVAHVRRVDVDTPAGFVGNATAVPELCPAVEDTISRPSTCPPGSVVGGITVVTAGTTLENKAIYAIEPEAGAPAQFAFALAGANATYSLAARLRPEEGYAIRLESAPVVQTPPIVAANATLCGFGAKVAPDSEGEFHFAGCKEAGEPDPDGAGPFIGANPIPFITNPTRCAAQPPTTTLRVDSWEQPGNFDSKSFTSQPVTGCDRVKFEPDMSLSPTSREADSPSGLEVELTVPTQGLLEPEGIAQANLKSAKVTLPEGMALNPAAAQGLGACTLEEIGMNQLGVPSGEPVRCPNSAKVGTLDVETPLLDGDFTGDLYVAKQQANPFGSLLALYMVIESQERGVLVKLAGKVEPDPRTGRLAVTFDENPEIPFSRLKLSIPQTARSPLINPPTCGNYEIGAELSPWNAVDPPGAGPQQTVIETSKFTVDRGPSGGPCPSGALEPRLSAGTENPVAGKTSPFVMRLSRDDGSQRFSSLTLSPPLGLTAYLKGVPYCPDAVLSGISVNPGTGQAQIANPSCPAASQVGIASAGAGAGPSPFYVDTGRAYLAGPYRGAPLSLALVTPAVAGPFDLGNVVVRTALHIDPKTAQIRAVTDPIPTILHGIPLDIRDIRLAIDRPRFILNPTSCEEKSLRMEVRGAKGDVASLSNRFQVGGCRDLGFKPRLNVTLFGGVKRGSYQGLRAVLRARPGDANIGRTVVRFPRWAFIAQNHLDTICTRVQWAADACPKGSIYGRALAYSPLLDFPLRGNVYMRSSDNVLPDLVADLRGPAHQPIRIELVGKTDSVNRALRNTFEAVPDAPVSYFRLRLFGGDKALIENSRNVCRGKSRATVRFDAQNGKQRFMRPILRNSRCKKERQGGGKGGGDRDRRR
jgi:hypothetical protein